MSEPEEVEEGRGHPEHPHGTPPGQDPDFVPPGHGGTPPGEGHPDADEDGHPAHLPAEPEDEESEETPA